MNTPAGGKPCLPIESREKPPEWTPPQWWKPEYFDCPLYEYKTKKQLQVWLYGKSYREKNKEVIAKRCAERAEKNREATARRRRLVPAQLETAFLLAAQELKHIEREEDISPERYLLAVVKVAEARAAIRAALSNRRFAVQSLYSFQTAPQFEIVLVGLHKDVERLERNLNPPLINSAAYIESAHRGLAECRIRLARVLNERIAEVKRCEKRQINVKDFAIQRANEAKCIRVQELTCDN